jgi:putative membrane protein insertion efficiency factor
MRILSFLILRIIDLYSVTLGSHLGGRCRFEPSCSHYAREAVTRFGPFKGLRLSIMRMVKCGPWHPGGLDPVPPK